MTTLYFHRYGVRPEWVYYDAHDKPSGRHFMILATPLFVSGTVYQLVRGRENPSVLYHIDWVSEKADPDEMKRHLTKWANGEVGAVA